MSKPDPQALTPEYLRRRIADSIAPWRQALKSYSLEQLNQADPNGGWSLGQVFTHCYLAASRMFIPMAETCIEEGEVDAPGQKNEMGENMFTYQSFPPIEIKMPEGLAFDPPVPDALSRLESQLDKIEARAMDAIDALAANPNINATTTHPAFGELTAQEWVLFTSMHYDHHLRQKNRLEKEIQ